VDRQCDVIIVIDEAIYFVLQLLMRKQFDPALVFSLFCDVMAICHL